MKAIQLKETGGPEVLRLVEVETPQPGQGQVLIKVAVAGVNFGETLQRAGTYPMPTPLPTILGSEAAGTVAALGPGVSGPALGTRVAAFFVSVSSGGYAEYVAVDADKVFPLPDEVDYAQACALLAQGLTAYYLLHLSAPPKSGQSVIINAAAGGIGTILVQLAKLLGAGTVIATASSTSKLDLARRLGADVGINYTQEGWEKQVKEATGGKGADIILEPIGGKIGEQSFGALAPFGRMVIYGLSSGEWTQFTTERIVQLVFQNQSLVGFALPSLLAAQPERSAEGVRNLLGYVAEGKLKIIVDHAFPIAEAAAAHHAIEERKTTGKVVLTV